MNNDPSNTNPLGSLMGQVYQQATALLSGGATAQPAKPKKPAAQQIHEAVAPLHRAIQRFIPVDGLTNQ